MHLTIKYGSADYQIDVTNDVLSKCVTKNVIHIPSGEGNRSDLFSDPCWGILKSIFITDKNGTYIYDHETDIFIDENEIYTDNIPEYIKTIFEHVFLVIKLRKIHSKINIDFGKMRDEFPEQLMSVRYLRGNEKVLEIGGNIGRNSLVIASLLNDQKNLVTLECDTNIYNQLIHNRNKNNMTFFVENAALSKRKLIQKGWDTISSDVLLDGYSPVNIISWEELQAKYMSFDTLVLDCEGAFYYILMDMPEILTNIQLIIMENDYYEIEKKEYVDSILKQNFAVDYSEKGGWGPCKDRFFEVWKRMIK